MLFSQTVIFRSVQPVITSALATGSGNNLTISSGAATFANALPDTVGVGDAVQYDDDNDGDIDANDSICFIHARTSSTVFTVKNAAGANPTDTAAADQDWSIFRAFTTLANWENGDENTGIDVDLRAFDAGTRNIVTNNEQWNIACYRGRDTVQLIQSGWTTGATNFVKIYTPYLSTEVGTSQRHAGIYTTLCYRMEPGNVNFCYSGASAGDKHFRLEGLQFNPGGNGTGTSIQGAVSLPGAANADFRISYCIFAGITGSTTSTTRYSGIVDNAASGTVKIWNCIFYGFNSSNSSADRGYENNDNGVSTIYNSTFYDCVTSFRNIAGDNPTVKNCVVQSATDGFNGTFHANSNYNISNIASDAPGANSQSGVTVTFVNTGTNDYHLLSTDTIAKNTGVNLSGDATIAITDDIDRDARPIGAAYDVGADEEDTTVDYLRLGKRLMIQ